MASHGGEWNVLGCEVIMFIDDVDSLWWRHFPLRLQ